MKGKMMDLLRIDYINSLGALMVSLIGDKSARYDLEVLDVQTGCLRFNVCGKSQLGHISDIGMFIDWDGNEYDPDTFYMDYIDKEQQDDTE